MNNKLFFTVLSSVLLSLSSQADEINVSNMKYSGPYKLCLPFMVDKVDVNSKKFVSSSLLETPIPINDVFKNGQKELAAGNDGVVLPSVDRGYAAHLLGFIVENTTYGKIKLDIDGLKEKHVYVDGEEAKGDSLSLEPGTHKIVVKCLTESGETARLSAKIGAAKNFPVSVNSGESKRMYSMADVLHGKRFSSASLSPNGQYLITTYNIVLPGGTEKYMYCLSEVATGRVVAQSDEGWKWMPHTNKCYRFQEGQHGREMITLNPATGTEEVLADNMPQGYATMSPTEDYMLFSIRNEGPKERNDVFEILEPEDRQPGWRNRSSLAKYDLKSHVMQPLTFGYANVYLNDISHDGRFVLFSIHRSHLESRPTSVSSYCCLDLQTMTVDTLVASDGFLGSAEFSPDGKKVLFQGSPECFDGIGKNVKPGQIPNMYDYQLYLMDIATKQVEPLTKTFNPAVTDAKWSNADGMIYFTAENKDCVDLYSLNPRTKHITAMNIPEDIIQGFNVAADAKKMICCGQGASNSDRIYTVDLVSGKTVVLEDLSKVILDGVELGECNAWNFVNAKGDTITGRYYLPPHFDATKKYPMIVNYYGGCSPTSRNFESRYPHHVFASQGYVVYVIIPSGSTGFGQEFSARHVNTAGEGVADDIIEGTKKFVETHSFVNGKKIGCIGASYGGFMTQYLQTKTDIFAAAISHAGISDHTSYWGEGYWGYSYSEVSMAESYPWTRKDLYVDRSPLFNADKIHTPLLFLHGNADTNVPIGESIQMFTALKLLGRPTAFVVVEGQNHHILDYGKRLRWQNTIFAWFQKWLKDDCSWWESMYPTKNL